MGFAHGPAGCRRSQGPSPIAGRGLAAGADRPGADDTEKQLRMMLHLRQAEEREGRTREGRQYHQLARRDQQREDWAAAARNLQTALTFEPGNEFFSERLAEIKKKIKDWQPDHWRC